MKTPSRFRFPTVDTVLHVAVICAVATMVVYVVLQPAVLSVLA